MTNLLRSLLTNRLPGQVVIQITDRCNARCPQCGMRSTESFARSTLETDAIKRTIDAAATRGVQAISFTGGEPLLDLPRLVDLIRYAGAAGIPFIRTGTNGFMFANPEKRVFENRVCRMVEQLADSPLRNFWISLDSAVDPVHEWMRGFSGVETRPVGCIATISALTGPIWTGSTPFIQAPLNGFTSGRSIWDAPWPTPAIP